MATLMVLPSSCIRRDCYLRPYADPRPPGACEIVGRVIGDDGAALPGATITICAGKYALRHTITGVDGTFRVGALPGGTYEVCAELACFAHDHRRLTLSEETTGPFILILDRRSDPCSFE